MDRQRLGWVVAMCFAATSCIQLPNEPEPKSNASDQEVTSAPVAPSFSLTTGDGTALDLVGLEIRGAIQAPLAFTELHLTFENPQDRVLAGEFMIDLPRGASPSRFAMKIDDAWQESEMIERQRARAIYSDILHRGVDPAMLEKQVGNRFRAKVFPIPARGRKELVLSYAHVLDDADAAYHLALRGLGPIESYSSEFFVHEPSRSDRVASPRVVRARHEDFAPREDLRIEIDEPPSTAVHSDVGVAVRVQIPGASKASPLRPLTIAFDTSASRSLGYAAHVQRLGQLVEAIALDQPDLELQVWAYDQTAASIFEGTASGFGNTQLQRLLARGALGASSLGVLLTALEDQAPPQHLVLLTDGLLTAGATDLDGLRTHVGRLRDHGLQRLDAILDPNTGSEEQLGALVHGTLPDDGTISNADRSAAQLVRRLGRPVLGPLTLQIEGAQQTWPSEIRGKQPGDSVVVYAKGQLSREMHVTMSGAVQHDFELLAKHVPSPLVQRAIAAAEIAAKTERWSSTPDERTKQTLREAIVRLSVEQRVLSEFTAMLVLESDAEYERYDIDLTATLNLLTIEDQGVALSSVHRVQPDKLPPARLGRPLHSPHRHAGEEGIMGQIQSESGHFLASPYGGAFAVGNDDEDVWGGLSSGGTFVTVEPDAYGDALRGARPIDWKVAPRIRPRLQKVTHGLPRDMVRRIVRHKLTTIRTCYEYQLTKTPTLRGSMDVSFTVGASGRTISPVITSDELPRSTTRCIASAIRRWRFARPSRGSAQVDLSFDLEPGVRAKPRVRTHRPRAPRHVDAPVPRDIMLAEEVAPYVGEMAEVMNALERGDRLRASELALAWHRRAPRDVLALVALGETLQAGGRMVEAARAYGSLIDLYPDDAPKLRYASARLQALGEAGHAMAIDAARQAVDERPEHPSSHHNLAWALANARRYEEAFSAIAAGTRRTYGSLYPYVEHILLDDAELISAAWLASSPERADEIRNAARDVGVMPPTEPSAHFVLSWETDANDVDLHVFDGTGQHAWYRDRGLDTGGRLYADVTGGFGPESFFIDGVPAAYPYHIGVHYFRRGAMGHGLGVVRVINLDDQGKISVDTVPFVLMTESGRTHVHTVEDPRAG